MIVIGIDPGQTESAIVVYDSKEERVILAKQEDNDGLALRLCLYPDPPDEYGDLPDDLPLVAIESTTYYGKNFSVGKSTMDTCIAIGRFQQCAIQRGFPYILIPRIKVRSTMCGNAAVGDSEVMAAVIDRFGCSRVALVGNKKKPGPLYGVAEHRWSALAVALTALETAHKEATA